MSELSLAAAAEPQGNQMTQKEEEEYNAHCQKYKDLEKHKNNLQSLMEYFK
jgi:hypothetical protein